VAKVVKALARLTLACAGKMADWWRKDFSIECPSAYLSLLHATALAGD